MNGALIEGAGIAPDIDVRRTIGDFRTGRDPNLEAAERLFQASAFEPLHITT